MRNVQFKPNFLIIGAMKAGSTSLRYHLSNHPYIAIPNGEPHFFDSDINYSEGEGWYKDKVLKNSKNGYLICGEKTPSYLYYEKCAERIYALNPDIKIIVILRNPIQRSYSHYWHAIKKGNEYLSFEKAVEKEISNYSSIGEYNKYLERSDYQKFIKIYLNFFSYKQFCFIKFEDLKGKPEETLRGLFKFLELPPKEIEFTIVKKNVTRIPSFPIFLYLSRKVFGKNNPIFLKFKSLLMKKAPGYPPMKIVTYQFLKKYFEEKNTELSKLINIDVSDWD